MSVVTQTLAEVEIVDLGGFEEVEDVLVGDVVSERGGSAVLSRRNEHGMVSAEWAVGLIAAIAIAGVLLAVVTNGAVKDAILQFILLVIKAFSAGLPG